MSSQTTASWTEITVGFWRDILVGGGLIAGLSGLVIAGRTMAQVDNLTQDRPAIVERMGSMEMELSALRGAVEARHKAAEAERQMLEGVLEDIRARLRERGQ